MTLGKDVSALFPDVLKNIATGDLDQKKLVYLYLMCVATRTSVLVLLLTELAARNYAKSHPDLCILAVNTFVQDSEDPNPLVRALAIRTMGCIRVEKMVDYMEEPLRKTLRDESPYVRKTAVLCVAKLFDLNPDLCLENGFLEQVQELIGDPNPMVVANSVTALAEIQDAAPETKALVITPTTLKKMLLALNECTEWGRVTILSTLADYSAADVKESEHICERVAPQFQHVNPSVVLAAVKVVFLHMRYINQELARAYTKKMAPPLGMQSPSRIDAPALTKRSHLSLLCSRSSVRRPPQHRSHPPKIAGHSQQGDAGLLLQIQRSSVPQIAKIRDHGSDSQ
jgi:AP-1 complex subunit beta-1